MWFTAVQSLEGVGRQGGGGGGVHSKLGSGFYFVPTTMSPPLHASVHSAHRALHSPHELSAEASD